MQIHATTTGNKRLGEGRGMRNAARCISLVSSSSSSSSSPSCSLSTTTLSISSSNDLDSIRLAIKSFVFLNVRFREGPGGLVLEISVEKGAIRDVKHPWKSFERSILLNLIIQFFLSFSFSLSSFERRMEETNRVTKENYEGVEK